MAGTNTWVLQLDTLTHPDLATPPLPHLTGLKLHLEVSGSAASCRQREGHTATLLPPAGTLKEPVTVFDLHLQTSCWWPPRGWLGAVHQLAVTTVRPSLPVPPRSKPLPPLLNTHNTRSIKKVNLLKNIHISPLLLGSKQLQFPSAASSLAAEGSVGGASSSGPVWRAAVRKRRIKSRKRRDTWRGKEVEKEKEEDELGSHLGWTQTGNKNEPIEAQKSESWPITSLGVLLPRRVAMAWKVL